MNKLLVYTATIAVVVAAGCDGGESRTIATSAASSEGNVIPLLADLSGGAVGEARPMILASVDGTVQEEVVYIDGPLPVDAEAEVFEVPEIIASALSGAPAIEAEGEDFVERQLILKNADGTVQEEVVFVDSDDELGSVEEAQTSQPDEVGVATLQVPAVR